MTRRQFMLPMLATLIYIGTGSIWADEKVYGSQLMTEKERNEHRNQLRSAKNEQERKQIRKEHHERMKVRAEKRGLSMPDEVPARGGGMGSGRGTGSGGGGGGGRR